MCSIGDYHSFLDIPEDKPLVGYRWFRVEGRATDTHLMPLVAYSGCWWKPIAVSDLPPKPETVASLLTRADMGWAAARARNTGLHVFHSLGEALNDPPVAAPLFAGRYALGEVEYWGPTAVHDFGSRAHCAKVVSLAVDSDRRFALAHSNPHLRGLPELTTNRHPLGHRAWRPHV